MSDAIRLPHLRVGEEMPGFRSPPKIEAPRALTAELTDADIQEIVRHDTEDVR